MVVNTSWLVAITAAAAKRHSKRIERYTSVMRKDNRIAMIAPRRSSCPTRGPTPSVRTTFRAFSPNFCFRTLPMVTAMLSAPFDCAATSRGSCARTVNSRLVPNCWISAP